MPNYAAQLGEAVGKLVEDEIKKITVQTANEYGLYADTGGERPEKRTGKKLLFVNDTNNEYQIDAVIEDDDGNPLILVESKYFVIRNTIGIKGLGLASRIIN